MGRIAALACHACGEEPLARWLDDSLSVAAIRSGVPAVLHDKASALFRSWVLVGGMPAAVQAFVRERSFLPVAEVHRELLPVTITQLAQAADMHPNAFVRRFRTETGLTPHAWQVRARIEQACLALERDDTPIDAIAERFGFCDRSHFTRTFTRLRGVGPGTYRRDAVPHLRG